MFAHLHCRSWFSFLQAASSPEALAARAAELGIDALAITDVNGVYGAVRFQKACRAHGVRPIFGSEVRVDGGALVLLALDQHGYANLCGLLTKAHLRCRDEPEATWEELCEHADGLHCLTGTQGGLLWQHVDADRFADARRWLHDLHEAFGDRLSVELAHHGRKGDRQRTGRLYRLAREAGIPVVATGDVLYARREDYATLDLLTCVRQGITIFEPHPARPSNGQQCLASEREMRRCIPYPEAFTRAAEIAAACRVDLIPGYITPPGACLPEGAGSPRAYLHRLCREGLIRLYEPKRRPAAAMQLRKELGVIESLDLDEYFLVVHEVVEESRRRGIRCAGRGSAANSIVAYLLGITGVDPIAHKLLFERFLHGGRKGTPDIDVDFDSERRDEIISWMEERFGTRQTAMTATLQTYHLRSALRDAAKAFGWPMEVVNDLGKAVSHAHARDAHAYRAQIEQVLGRSPLVDTLIASVERLDGCPRHLGLHVGGMVLSRRPLYHFTPVQKSANGVKVIQFDKDDAEALGLVKFDVLGLRMLSCISEALELIHRHIDPDFDLDAVPLDDAPTFNMIRASRTLACFQIESQGQLHLLARNQPDTFDDLIAEIALFRPGPVQGNMVNPFVRRRRGFEKVAYEHPDLEPILKDTYGIILFQEQNLEIAHHFAGMSLEEADEFRRLMSKYRNKDEMEKLRDRFVGGAVGRGVPEGVANKVFDHVAFFVGYGFCRSHAAAFARTVYQSCYLKCHYPAAYMAAFMQHRPGMYDLMTLEEDARRFGAPTLLPDINASGVRYDIEPFPAKAQASSPPFQSLSRSIGKPAPNLIRGGVAGGCGGSRFAIRKPLTSIRALSEQDAWSIVRERLVRPFESLEDFYRRVPLSKDVLHGLARSGALDILAGDSRRALWEVGLLENRLGASGQGAAAELFEVAAFTADDVPDLAAITEAERVAWDLQTHSASRVHPMTLVRRQLAEHEIRPIETCYRFGRTVRVKPGGPPPLVTIAGLAILRQRPPTAKGTMFLTLQDETGFIQCVVRPEVLEALDHVLRRSSLIVSGELAVHGNWRGLVVRQAWPLDGMLGGYEGHPNNVGGKDRWIVSVHPRDASMTATV